MKYYERRGSMTVGSFDPQIRSSEREKHGKITASNGKDIDPSYDSGTCPGAAEQEMIIRNPAQSPVDLDMTSSARRNHPEIKTVTDDPIGRQVSPSNKNIVVLQKSLGGSQGSMPSVYDSALANWMDDASGFDPDLDDGDFSYMDEDESSFHASYDQSTDNSLSLSSHHLAASLLSVDSDVPKPSNEVRSFEKETIVTRTDDTSNIQEMNKSNQKDSDTTCSVSKQNTRYGSRDNSPHHSATNDHSYSNGMNIPTLVGSDLNGQRSFKSGVETTGSSIANKNNDHYDHSDLVNVSISLSSNMRHTEPEKTATAKDNYVEKDNQYETTYKEQKNDRKIRKDRQVVMAEAADESYQKKVVPKSENIKNLIYESIKSNILFTRCSREELLQIVDAFEPVQYNEGSIIIKEGDQGNNLYVMEKGAIDILVCDKYIKTITDVGCAFGEIALLYNTPRTATVRAKTKCLLWSIHRFDYRGIIRQVNLSKAETKSDFLRKVKLGDNVLGDVLQPAEIYNIALATKTMTFNAGDVIIKEGEKGDNFFLIEHGTVEVFKEGCGESAITKLGVSDSFGEKALVNESDVRTATCVASSETVRCLVLFRDDFRQMLGDVTGMLRKSWQLRTQKIYQKREGLGRKMNNKKKAESQANEKETRIVGNMKASDFKIIRTIGIGSFGNVKLVRLKKKSVSKLPNSSELTYALKCQNKESLAKSGFLSNVQREKEIMSEIDHPFVIRLYSAMEDEKNIYFVLEVLLGGEVFKLLEIKGSIPEDWSKFYAASVVLAFSAIHEKKIAYRDLKTENIVLDSKGYPKVIDFGLSKRIEHGKTWTLCGTPDYMAPEVILNEGHDWAVDYWALGILIYEMINGDPPYMSENPMDVYKLILSGRLNFPSFFSTTVKDIIRKLLSPHQSTRLGRTLQGTDAVMKHDWFSNMRFSILLKQRYHAPYIPNIKNAEDTSNFEKYEEDEEDFPDDSSDSSNDSEIEKIAKDGGTFKICGNAIVARPKTPPLTFKGGNLEGMMESRLKSTKNDNATPVKVTKDSFLSRAFGADFGMDCTTHTTHTTFSHIGFSISREPSVHGSFHGMGVDSDLDSALDSDSDSDSDSSSEENSIHVVLDSKPKRKSLLEEVKAKLMDEALPNICKDKTELLTTTSVPNENCSSGDPKIAKLSTPSKDEDQKIDGDSPTLNEPSKKSLGDDDYSVGELEDNHHIPAFAKLFQSLRGSAIVKMPNVDEHSSVTSSSTRSTKSRWRRATAFILGASHVPKINESIEIRRQSSLLTLHQERERRKTYCYQRYGKTGVIVKSLYEAKISMENRISPVVKLEYTESRITEQRGFPTFGVKRDQEDTNESDRSRNSDIDKASHTYDYLDEKQSDILAMKSTQERIVSNMRDFRSDDQTGIQVTSLEEKDRPRLTKSLTLQRPKLSDNSTDIFLSSRKIVQTIRTSTGDLSDSDNLEKQFEVYDNIIRDAKEKVKIINSALSSLGVASPFRSTEEIVPRFGELHMHIKSHLSRNAAGAFSFGEKKRRVQRRNEFICRLQVRECIRALSTKFGQCIVDSSHENSYDLTNCSSSDKEEIEEDTHVVLSNHVNDSEKNGKCGKGNQTNNVPETSDVGKSRTSIGSLSETTLGIQTDQDNDIVTKSEVTNAPHFVNAEKNDNDKQSSLNVHSSGNNLDDSKKLSENADYHDEDVQIVTLFLGKIFGFKDKTIQCHYHTVSSALELENLGKNSDPGDARIDQYEDLSFLANCMYYASLMADKQDQIDFLRPTSLCLASGYKFEFLMAIFSHFEKVLPDIETKERITESSPESDDIITDQSLLEMSDIIEPIINLTPQELRTVQSAMRRILADEEVPDTSNEQRNERSRVATTLRHLFSDKSLSDQLQNEQNNTTLPPNVSDNTLGDVGSLGWDNGSVKEENELPKKPFQFLANITNSLINKNGENVHKEVSIQYRTHHHNHLEDSPSDAINFKVSIIDAEDRMDVYGRNFTVYVLEVNEVGKKMYYVEHRYSEFDRLNLAIMQEKISMHSDFPQKHAFKAKEHTKIVNGRKAALNIWLIELTGHLACGKITGHLKEKCIDFLQHSDNCMIHSESNSFLRKVDGLKSSLIQFGRRNASDDEIINLDAVSDADLLEDWPSP